MLRFYVVWGTVVCALLAYGNWSGWKVMDFSGSGKWGPKGRSAYHK